MANYLLAGGLGLVVGAVGGWLGLQSWGPSAGELPGQCKAYIALPGTVTNEEADAAGAQCLAAVRVGDPLTPPDLSGPEPSVDADDTSPQADGTEPAAEPADGPA